MSILFFLRTTANVQEFESSQITKTLLKIIWKGVAVVHNGYSRIRTCDTSVNSRSLYQLSYTPVGCLLLTPFTLSALGYADYTKYRLLNLYLFVLQICGYLPLVPLQCKSGVHSQNRPQLCSLYTHITKRSTWNRTKDTGRNPAHLPLNTPHKNTARRERVKVRRCSECSERKLIARA